MKVDALIDPLDGILHLYARNMILLTCIILDMIRKKTKQNITELYNITVFLFLTITIWTVVNKNDSLSTFLSNRSSLQRYLTGQK